MSIAVAKASANSRKKRILDEATADDDEIDEGKSTGGSQEELLSHIVAEMRTARETLEAHSRVLQALVTKANRKRRSDSSDSSGVSSDEEEEGSRASKTTATESTSASALAEAKGFSNTKVLQTPRAYEYIPERLFTEVHLRTALRDRYPVSDADNSFTAQLQKTFRDLLVKVTFGTVQETQQTTIDQL